MVKAIQSRSSAVSHWQRHWYLWSSAYLCQQSVWHRAVPSCSETCRRRGIGDGCLCASSVQLQLSCWRVPLLAPPAVGLRCVWAGGCRLHLPMVWSRARVGARGAADFASLAVSVGQEAEAACCPRHASSDSIILSVLDDPFHLVYS